MYRLLAAAYIVLLFFVFLFMFATVDQSASNDTMIAASKTTATPEPTDEPAPTETPIPTPTAAPVANPVRIVIPKLNIDTVVESKGNDAEGHMDVPSDWNHTAWYNLGPKPGEEGAAVVAGHFDTNTGGPAVFYYLSALLPGDNINVIDETGKTMTFTVVDKRNYEYYSFPVDEVFSDRSGHKMNLITCSGVWDFRNHNYTDRLVIFTELQ